MITVTQLEFRPGENSYVNEETTLNLRTFPIAQRILKQWKLNFAKRNQCYLNNIRLVFVFLLIKCYW